MFSLRMAVAAPIMVMLLYAPVDAALGGLSAPQLSELRHLGFAVVPDPPPASFRVTSIRVDAVADSYRVVYRRSGDGATLTFTGRRLTEAPTPAPKKKRGLFNQLADAVDHIGERATPRPNQVAGTGSRADNTSQEEEEEMSSVQAYSPVIGPSHFAQDHGCLTGSPDPTQAEIHNAEFHVTGCNLARPDALTRAYRSLVRVGS